MNKILVIVALIVIVGIVSILIFPQEEAIIQKQTQSIPELRVAFIGDQGLGPNAIAVLELIKDEGAQMVLHQGDFDYKDDPGKWDRRISDVLGSDFPYFASIGHHDVNAWSGYQEKLYDRLKKNPDAVCNGDLGVKSSCSYRGLFFLLVAPGDYTSNSDYDSFIQKQLNDNGSNWRICSWHNDMKTMQSEVKPNETGWEVYESCKNGGAIIANAHAHSYARSKTLIDFENQIVDPEWSEPNKLRVMDGATFTFISGLGGMPVSGPEHYEWPVKYSSEQGATSGALFCTFNAGGQPNKAYCYFKNIDGRIIDEFTITSFLGTYHDSTNLIDVDMSGRDLTGDDLSNTIITDTNLSDAILVGADLSNAVLIGTTLTGADLTDANLAGVSLAYKDLTGTILRGADLTDANLTGVSLTGRDLTGTILRGINLADKDLTGTILTGADLTGTKLTDFPGIDLTDKDLTGAILRNTDLTDKDLTGTILRGADLTDANLAGVSLAYKDLTGTILTGADLTGAVLPSDYLSGKNFQGTIFNGVDLSGKDLSNSDFSYADFAGTNLENTNLTGAKFVDVDLTKIKNKSLAGADLSRTSFAYSNLSDVSLAGAILKVTNFHHANLSGLDFTVTDVITDGIIFIKSNLSNSNFEGVDLSPKKKYFKIFENKAYLMREVTQSSEAEYVITGELFGNNAEYRINVVSVEVRGNDLAIDYIYFNHFGDANLKNANFKNTKLLYANFNKANLTNADLSGAEFGGTVFDGTDLSNANLSDAYGEMLITKNTILNCKNHVVCTPDT